MDPKSLAERLQDRFQSGLTRCEVERAEVTAEVPPEALREVCLALRDEEPFVFQQLMDACGVDYLDYGKTTFSQGAQGAAQPSGVSAWSGPRYAVVYHLLSLTRNHRLRLRVPVDGEPPLVDSVTDIWNSANWFEREAFDLFGILFDGHPDLRRILTDYGFVGHPFRKDFPLIGNVEVRYDIDKQRVVYQPVSIEPRVLVPRVIRDDSRYVDHRPVDRE
jgi:NADH-quinone oxidoreductase subunit C